ncbi:MAG: hypothetical protein RLZZ188_1789 [Verrucomicrobiota bacterium]
MPSLRLLLRLAAAPAVFAATAFASAAEPPPPAFADIRKIDVHSHIFEDVPAFHDLFRRLNVRTINVCVPGGDGHLETMNRIALELRRKEPTLYPFTTTFDVTGHEDPRYAEKVITWLDSAFANGAVAVKIWKEVGIGIRGRNGKFILPDDPRFDTIYAYLARRGKPLHAHLAEPIDAWLPLSPESPHYGYYSGNPQWHLHGKTEYPSHGAIIAARDNILRKHPSLVVVGAHLGSLEHDLEGIARRLEQFPNFHIEVAARTRNLARHPSDQVRALFLRFPNRIMYGVDSSWKPHLRAQPPTDKQREAHATTLEVRYRADFEYYAGRGEITYSGRRTQALGLPREVLGKFYHENAERIYGLRTAWEKR